MDKSRILYELENARTRLAEAHIRLEFADKHIKYLQQELKNESTNKRNS